MKTTRTAKALLSFVLVMAMLFSMCMVGFVSASAASLGLSYEFAYKNAGYAEGRITLTGGSADNGTYYLYWADDTKALEGYHEVAKLQLSSGTRFFEMDADTAIPAAATKLIAIKGTTEPATKTVAAASAVYNIPADKQLKEKAGAKQYDFMALSDVHIQHNDSYWVESKAHLANSLEVATKRNVEFITMCGDMVNGYSQGERDEDYRDYQKIIAQSSFTNPIYETNGNHEMKGTSNDSNRNAALTQFAKATGLNATTGALQSTPYYEKTINGDHYIFLILELSGDPNKSSEFTDTQLNWFENLLKKYKNDGHKIIVNQHCLIAGYGAGDNKQAPYYKGALQQSYADVKRYMSILEANRDIIVLSGHSHIDFKYGYNFDNENGKTCYTVHIPSNSSTTHPNAAGNTDYIMSPDSSQGYLVDIFDDYVILNGTDLAKDKIYPAYTYLVDYTGEALVKNDMEDIEYDTLKVTVDVSALSDAPSAVSCNAYSADDASDREIFAMKKNSDGTYSVEVPDYLTKMTFTVTDANGNITTNQYDVKDNCFVKIGVDKVTYLSNNFGDNVHLYAWSDMASLTWPGIKMNKASDGTYYSYVPASTFSNVIFNDGKKDGAAQTKDLVVTPDLKITNLDGSAYADAKYEHISDDVYTAEGVEPTTPVTTAPVTTVPVTTMAPDTTAAPVEPTAVPPVGVQKVYHDNNKTQWDEVYVYAYSTEKHWSGKVENAPYPGEPAKYEGGNRYSFQYTTGYYEFVEFNPGIVESTAPATTAEPTEIITVPATTTAPATTAEPTEVITVPVITTTAPATTAEPTEVTTAPVVSTPDETTVPATTETTVPAVEYLYGDADLDGKVNIKDATAIQKFAAKMIEFDETAMVQADVTADGKVNVKDATSIQKYVAKFFDKFPVEEAAAPALVSVGATGNELTLLVSTAKTKLAAEYQYASYDAYMAVKKAYYAVKDKAVADMTAAEIDTAYNNLNTALSNYDDMKKNNPIANYGDAADGENNTGGSGGTTLEGMITIYFSDTNNWGKVYAHLFGTGGDMATWPGAAMTYDRTSDSGKKIYKITFDSSKYQSVVFNNGNGVQTLDVKITADQTVYHLDKESSGKWSVGSYAYKW